MSIQSEITRISGNVSDALTAISNKGVTVPSGSNSDDLADLIALIESGGGGSGGIIYQDLDGYLHLSEEAANVISIVDTLDTAGGTIRTITGATESGGGGKNIYYTQYTLTGDTTIATFIPAIAYEVHSTSCIIILRSNGTVAPSTGSYTMNNLFTLFQSGVRKSAAEHYVSGKSAPNNTTSDVLLTKETNTLISMTDGVLTTTSIGTSCIGAAGDIVTLVEIDVDDDFYDILKAVKSV